MTNKTMNNFKDEILEVLGKNKLEDKRAVAALAYVFAYLGDSLGYTLEELVIALGTSKGVVEMQCEKKKNPFPGVPKNIH
jgi:hypothetical protein